MIEEVEGSLRSSEPWWHLLLGSVGTLVGGALAQWWLLKRQTKHSQGLRLQEAYAAFCTRIERTIALFELSARLEEGRMVRFFDRKEDDPRLEKESAEAWGAFKDSRSTIPEAKNMLLMFERSSDSRSRIDAFIAELDPLLRDRASHPTQEEGWDPLDDARADVKAASAALISFQRFQQQSYRLPQLG